MLLQSASANDMRVKKGINESTGETSMTPDFSFVELSTDN